MMRAGYLRQTVFSVAVSVLCLSGANARLLQAENTYAQAQAAYQKGDQAGAAPLFEQAEKEAPGITDALLLAGKCYAHLQQFAAAENALRRFVGRNPKSADGWYLLAFVLHRQNKPEESLAMYTKAAAITPPTGDDLKIVGLDYVLLKDYGDAIHWLERAVEMDPRNKEVWYYLGRAYYTQSLPEKARKAFETVLALDPHDARAENNLGLLYENEGKTEAAESAYRKAIDWQGEHATSAEQPYLNLGNLCLAQGRLDEAVVLLEKSVTLAQDNAEAHLKLGMAYLRTARMKDAQAQLEEAVRLDPGDAPAHYQLGRYYSQIKNMDAAKKEFERVAELQGRKNKTEQPTETPH